MIAQAFTSSRPETRQPATSTCARSVWGISPPAAKRISATTTVPKGEGPVESLLSAEISSLVRGILLDLLLGQVRRSTKDKGQNLCATESRRCPHLWATNLAFSKGEGTYGMPPEVSEIEGNDDSIRFLRTRGRQKRGDPAALVHILDVATVFYTSSNGSRDHQPPLQESYESICKPCIFHLLKIRTFGESLTPRA